MLNPQRSKIELIPKVEFKIFLVCIATSVPANLNEFYRNPTVERPWSTTSAKGMAGVGRGIQDSCEIKHITERTNKNGLAKLFGSTFLLVDGWEWNVEWNVKIHGLHGMPSMQQLE